MLNVREKVEVVKEFLLDEGFELSNADIHKKGIRKDSVLLKSPNTTVYDHVILGVSLNSVILYGINIPYNHNRHEAISEIGYKSKESLIDILNAVLNPETIW